VDLYSQDIGLVMHTENNKALGYSIYVGGGFGMTHGKETTYPCLAQPLFYCAKKDIAKACEAIIIVQRDNGDRTDRRHARLKYLVAERGIDWFKTEVQKIIDFPTQEIREANFKTVSDQLGWHEQGDGKLFVGIHVAQGRIKDNEEKQNRTAFRQIAQKFNCPIRITPNANIYFYDIEKNNRPHIDQILRDFNIAIGDDFTATRQTAHACVALPTCGLALSESERVFDTLLDSIDSLLSELKLEKDQILIRMTGCPNGCARPYNADFAFVGRAPNKYAMFVGGSSSGDRLASLHKKSILFDEIQGEIRILLQDFVKNRLREETFSEFWGRTHEESIHPIPKQFHLEKNEY